MTKFGVKVSIRSVRVSKLMLKMSECSCCLCLIFFVAKTQIICDNNKTCAKQKKDFALFPIGLKLS